MPSKEIPPLYGVYLLRSLAKQNSYYIGSTPDPYRRLRQHNGELSRGGAYRTKRKGYRPWRMAVYVHGFPSNISALQFEHAWQHAYKTRHIAVADRRHSGKKSTGSGTTVHEKLANCRLLLRAPSFARLGLRVTIFSKELYKLWLQNKFEVELPKHVLVDARIDDSAEASFIEGGNYEQLKQFMEAVEESQKLYLDRSLEVLQRTPPPVCSVCKGEIDPMSDYIGFCFHDDCTAVSHIQCWSKYILEDVDPSSKHYIGPVLPLKGACPVCSRVSFWNTVVRNAQVVQRTLVEKNQKDSEEVEVLSI